MKKWWDLGMWQRIFTAIVAGIVFLTVLTIGGKAYFILMLLLATVGYREFCQMMHIPMLRVENLIGIAYLWLIFFSIAEPLLMPFSPFMLTIGFLLTWLTWTVLSRNEVTFHTISSLFAGALYIGAGFAFMTFTRFLEEGLLLTLYVLAVTWASDSGAYFIGKRWGQKKLWPAISPNKTVAGSLGAILCASIVGGLFGKGLPHLFDVPNAFVLAIMISIVGQLGDLIESALKRTHEVKDSGRLLPGHGGVLDRFDSLLLTFLFLHVFQLLG